MTNNGLDNLSEKKSKKTTVITFVLIVAVVAVFLLLMLVYEREKPLVNITNDTSRFGASKDVSFKITDMKSGIRSITIQLIQGDKRADIYKREFERQGYFSHSGPNKITANINVDTASLGFNDGAAELVFTVRDYSFWDWTEGNLLTEKYPILIDTKAPKVSIVESPRYISPGGSGLIIYRVNEPLARHGVTVNGNFHPGFPVSDIDDGKFLAYIGLPYDTDKIEKTRISAYDLAGNEGTVAFGMVLKRASWKRSKINVSDNFLALKIPEFTQNYPQLSGTLLEQYLQVNNQVRKENNDTIKSLCSQPSPRRLWQGRFNRMKGSKQSGFADHRSYFFSDKEIDKQVHLGMDIASTRHARIKAANRGIVIHADYLGIYGNTVILDHGQGLFSLYAHLSQIDVKTGNTVEKNGVLGLSGTSGMAGGDHLHFSVLVNGIFVNPLEWWDGQWLRLNITDALLNR